MNLKSPSSRDSKVANQLTLFLLATSPIFILPWINFDPVNVPRLTLVSTFGFAGLYLFSKAYCFTGGSDKSSKHRFLFLSSLLLILSTLSTWFFADFDFARQLYGAFGRNNGVLATIGLLGIFLLASMADQAGKGKYFGLSIYIGGLANLIYGWIQYFSLDPVNWQNQYGPIVGAFGNPNFMSAFLAFFAIFLMSRIVYNTNSSVTVIFTWIGLFVFDVLLILATKSIQGIFVVVIGLLILSILRFKIYSRMRLFSLTLVVGLALGSVVVLGMLGRGFLGSILYQSTLEVRLYFWSAALQMLLASPLFGLGMDSFGTWYRMFRSEKAISAGDITADSAHNVLLDFGAWGGVPLLTSLLIIGIFVLFQAIKFIYSKAEIDRDFAFLFAAWIGFLAQAQVSINQLGLAIYGALLSGLLLSRIIGFSAIKKTAFHKLRFNFGVFVSLILGFLVALPLFLSDVGFRDALERRNSKFLIEKVERWPRNDVYLLMASNLLKNSGLDLQSVELAREAIAVNPNNVSALLFLYQSQEISSNERARIKEKIIQLDPWIEGKRLK